MVIAVVIMSWLTRKLLEDSGRRLRFDVWLLELPFIGSLVRQIEVARFARTLGTLLENGVPLMNAILLARDVMENRAIAGVMDAVGASLEQGQRLARPIRESGYFPSLAVQLIEVGEESGRLDSTLKKIADIYDGEVRRSIKRILTLLEPALIIFLGGIIATIILSILLALLGMNDLVG